MLLPGFRVGCTIAATCMLALATVLGSSLQETGMIAEKRAADALECSICLLSTSPDDEKDLMICPGSGTNPHGFHDKCIAQWLKTQAKSCPFCRKDWTALCEGTIRKMTDDLIQFYAEYKKLKEPPKLKLEKKDPGDAGCAEELRGVILQLADDFETPKALYDFARGYEGCSSFNRRLAKAYSSLSHKHAPFLLGPEIKRAFKGIVEEVLGKMPAKEACEALINAPKFVYTHNVFNLINSPMFYAQLSHEQIVDFGKHLFSLASKDSMLEHKVASFFLKNYIQRNLNVLDDDAVECLFDFAKSLKLDSIQFWMVQAIKVSNIKLSLSCRRKLAKLSLIDKYYYMKSYVSALQYLGYFTEFSDEMHKEVIDHWEEIMDKNKQEHEVLFKILSFKTIKPEENTEAKALELLIKIRRFTRSELLEWCHLMLCLRPSSSFLDKVYGLLGVTEDEYVIHRVISLIPSSEDRLRRDIALLYTKLNNSSHTSLEVARAVCAHPGVSIEDALRVLFTSLPMLKLKDRQMWALEFLTTFGLCFREDLGDRKNAELLSRKLEEKELYAEMLLFHEYLSETPHYEECIAEHMMQILHVIHFNFYSDNCVKALWALCDANNERIDKVLSKHFKEYLRAILSVYKCYTDSPQLPAGYFLEMILAKGILVRHIPADQGGEIVLILITDRNTKDNFDRYMEIFLSRIETEDKRSEMLRAVEDAVSSGELDDGARRRIRELVKKLSRSPCNAHLCRQD